MQEQSQEQFPEQSEEQRHQTIRGWSVAGANRIVGSVYNRPGQADGKTIMTSPVLQVRMMGEYRTPVAFTESGNAYWLGEPSTTFGLDRAESFVWHMSRMQVPPVPAPVDPSLQTMSMDRTTFQVLAS